MIGSRLQEYAYQHKTVSLANCYFKWLEKHTLVIFLPKDLIQIKNLYTYLAINFPIIDNNLGVPPQYQEIYQNSTPSDLRKISWVGGSGGRKVFNSELVNGVARMKYDFSNEFGLFGIPDGKPVTIDGKKTLKLEFGCGNTATNHDLVGKIVLWKVDLVYTTQGIR